MKEPRHNLMKNGFQRNCLDFILYVVALGFVSECLSEWVSEWVSDWVSEWVSERERERERNRKSEQENV